MKTQQLMHIGEMIATHPARPEEQSEQLVHCIESNLACAQSCTACADACLHEAHVDRLRLCIRMNLDCADICDTLARMLSRASRPDAATMRGMLQACVASCRACGEECEQHAGMHDHCRVCAGVCRECEAACQELLDVTP